MADFLITRIVPLDPPTRQGRALLLAAFDVEIAGLRLRNCFLVNRKDKGFKIFGPSHHVAFHGALAREMKNAARAAYEALDRP
ncbi:MAG: hypothetical protein P1U84_17570 [Parvibaculaceae bacterium]|nr:hypothetical protein [Parvibaculaceae bacterium]